jgi:DNA-binding response OmpR family regulator
MYRILCVEDSQEVQIILRASLSPDHTVRIVPSIAQARQAIFKEGPFDLVVLDIGLPDGDGLRFCAELRGSKAYKELPIVILTANHAIQEKTLGFQLGIEDYVSKPFEPTELRLRIESRLKKIYQYRASSDVLTLGPLSIHLQELKATLQLADKIRTIDFSTTEFRLLVYLARNAEQVKTREQIIAAVWQNGLHLSDRTVDSHISRIRQKLKNHEVTIEAVPGTGYRFSVRAKKAA